MLSHRFVTTSQNTFIAFSSIVFIGIFSAICLSILWNGGSGFTWDFIVGSPGFAGKSGGIFPVLVSTAWIVGGCLIFACPIGVFAGLMFSGKLFARTPALRFASHFVDILAAVPSIVFGLFGNIFFGEILGLGYSILSGSLTLTCMVLPITIRMAEDIFRAIPESTILASKALAIQPARCFFQIMLPSSLPFLCGAVILATARSLAETAALLFTSGYSMRLPDSILDSGRSLSIHIYELAMNVTGGDENAYRSASILLALLLLINLPVYAIQAYWRVRHGQATHC